MDETDKALSEDLHWPEDLIAYRREQITSNYPEAFIEGYEPIEACVTNDPKDRHVLAAAIRGKCEIIVTFNLKDFPAESLSSWQIEAHHPSKFLASLYSINQGLVVQRLHEIGAKLGRSINQVIELLAEPVPAFALQVASDIGIDL